MDIIIVGIIIVLLVVGLRSTKKHMTDSNPSPKTDGFESPTSSTFSSYAETMNVFMRTFQ